ncbi:MAG: hypothetical protein WBN07_05835 [Woeseiaceae bacterium]
MIDRRFAVPLVTLALIFAPGLAASGEALSLKEIMQGLRDDYVKIADGLLSDDLGLVADGASGVAKHPKIPPEQVKLVAAELGEEMPAFKQLDTRVHDLSLEIIDAAKAPDRDKALRKFGELTDGCIACHNTYKQRVASALD